MRTLQIAVVLLPFFFPVSGVAGASCQTELIERLKSEAPGFWSEKGKKIKGGVAIDGGDHKRIILNDNILSSGKTSDGTMVIFGANEVYEFRVDRSKNNNNYSLVWLNVYNKESSGSETQLRDVINKEKQKASELPTHVCGPLNLMSLAEVLDDPGFEILSAKSVTREETDCLEYAWKFVENNVNDSFRFPAKGRFWVVPELGWAIIEFEWNLFADKPDTYLMKGTLSNYVEFEGVWLPGQLKWKFTRELSEGIEERDGEFTYQKHHDSSEFHLTYYGLREPKGLQLPSKGWPWWVKLPLIGVVFVGIAALIKRSINKRKK